MSSNLLILVSLAALSVAAHAVVPSSATFKLVNSGDFGDYIVEYDGNYRTLDIFTSPFQLCFYNTTPNAYTLALRAGLKRSESRFFWVWEANRGNPVQESATFSLGTDGNLVLADSDGKVAWQSNTANKGVVGFKLLSNGNMVLTDAKGNFVWQSFDSPTDTLLVGQYLRPNGPTKLVSRASSEINANGPYTLVLEPRRIVMYYKSSNTPKPLLYFEILKMDSKDTIKNVTFAVAAETDDDGPYAYDLTLDYVSQNGEFGGSAEIARPMYNATTSLLRLGIDGNLKVYTYNAKVDWHAWETTFTLFSKDSPYGLTDTECQLPEKCGALGVCEDSQCVACPTPRGLLGWSKSCKAPKIEKCQGNANYFKVDGVDHFSEKFNEGDGPMKVSECGSKCSKDCKCMGYFYNKGSFRCWIAYDLMTLTKVENSTHVGYIKISG